VKRESKVFLAAIGLLLVGACLKLPLGERIECLRSTDDLRVQILSGAGDGTIALAYQLIPGELLYQYWKLRRRPTVEMLGQFAAFIVLCGATHIANILRFWYPFEYAFAVLKHLTGIVSLSVWWTLRRNRAAILGLGEREEQLDAANRALAAEVAAAQESRTAAEDLARDLARANEDRALQITALEARDRIIREFGAPILEPDMPDPRTPLVRRRVVVPLVGSIDPDRAREITHRLTTYAEAARPAHIILDLTGVDSIDTAVAHALHRLVRMLRLQGSQCVATGIRADVSRALVELDIELQMPTYSTLAAGLAATAGRAAPT
jgi:anti-anti-sigma factor